MGNSIYKYNSMSNVTALMRQGWLYGDTVPNSVSELVF